MRPDVGRRPHGLRRARPQAVKALNSELRLAPWSQSAAKAIAKIRARSRPSRSTRPPRVRPRQGDQGAARGDRCATPASSSTIAAVGWSARLARTPSVVAPGTSRRTAEGAARAAPPRSLDPRVDGRRFEHAQADVDRPAGRTACPPPSWSRRQRLLRRAARARYGRSVVIAWYASQTKMIRDSSGISLAGLARPGSRRRPSARGSARTIARRRPASRSIGARIRSPSSGCVSISCRSSSVSGPGFEQHRRRDADLADVVEERTELEPLQRVAVEPELLADAQRRVGDPAGV